MLLVGMIWIIVMTDICYRGIEVSANFQKALLGIELVMLLVLSVTALVKVGTGHAPPGHLTPSISWLNPFHIASFSAFASGVILMVFIYWGWDTAVAVNEETKDKTRTPGPGGDPLHAHPAGHLRDGDLRRCSRSPGSRPRATASATRITPVTCCRPGQRGLRHVRRSASFLTTCCC